MSEQNEIAISVKNVSKTFKLPHEKHASIKSALINIGRSRKSYEKQKVLDDVSFDIKKGEFFGIVGRNGSGKSTLLKLLAGIYTPDQGQIIINGKLTPFIELGVGFNPELTGRENVFLNGALLGFNRSEMEAMYDDIVAFAELKRFMDQKLKNYSSGMQVRLAFSIAIRARSDILLLDEVLAVGDENFQRKCYEYFAQLKKNKQTVVFISHDMGAVSEYCTNGLLLDSGTILESGSIKRVTSKYTQLNFSRLEEQTNKQESDRNLDETKQFGDGSAIIEKVWISSGGEKRRLLSPREEITTNIKIKASKDLTSPVVGMVVQDSKGQIVFATNTKELGLKLDDIGNGQVFTAKFTVDENIYTNDTYTISCAIASSDRSTIYARVEDAASFKIGGWPSSMQHSLTHPRHNFSLD